MTITFDSVDAAWWPYVFIFVAGALATHVWRWIGVIAGGALSGEGEALLWVKAVATALVAGVVGQLVVFPSGELAATPLAVRIAAAAIGWLAFMAARKTIIVGVLSAEAVLLGGWWLFV
jgi:hypothetical protein